MENMINVDKDDAEKEGERIILIRIIDIDNDNAEENEERIKVINGMMDAENNYAHEMSGRSIGMGKMI